MPQDDLAPTPLKITPLKQVHTSDRITFKQCRLKWEFSSPLRRGLSPVKTQPPLMFGSAVHSALESYYDPTFEERNPHRGALALSSYIQSWYSLLPNPDIEDDVLLEDSLALGQGMLDHYLATADDRFKVLAVEMSFEVPIPGISDAVYAGKLDGLIEDENGRIWVLEHKTADKLPDKTEYLLMDEQCGSYLWALEQQGIHAEGVLYNILRKKLPTKMKELKTGGLSQRADADTTYEYAYAQIKNYYEGEVPDKYVDWLEMLSLKGNRFFYRENVRRSSKEIAYLGKMIAIEAKEMLIDPAIYRNPTKVNCGFCPFVGPCLAVYGGDDYEAMLEGNYTKERR